MSHAELLSRSLLRRPITVLCHVSNHLAGIPHAKPDFMLDKKPIASSLLSSSDSDDDWKPVVNECRTNSSNDKTVRV